MYFHTCQNLPYIKDNLEYRDYNEYQKSPDRYREDRWSIEGKAVDRGLQGHSEAFRRIRKGTWDILEEWKGTEGKMRYRRD